MSDKFLDNLSRIYNIKFIKLENYTEKGYRNKIIKLTSASSDEYNLIVYKNEKDILKTIRNANFVSNYLFKKGFPVRKSIETKNDKDIIRLRRPETRIIYKTQNVKRITHYGCLYNYLPGNTIPWEEWTMKHLKLIGWAMGSMHDQLSVISLQLSALNLDVPQIGDVIQAQSDEMTEYFNSSGVKTAMQNKLRLKIDMNLFDLLSSHTSYIAHDTEQRTVLHMDLVRGNILFNRTSEKSEIQNPKFEIENLVISGILDFEKVAVGPVIFDIARTLAFLITDCKFKDEEKIYKYFLESGYEKRGGGRSFTKQELKTPLLYFWLYDFYKFLKHNPYEFLEENEHYKRVRMYLLKEKFLKWV